MNWRAIGFDWNHARAFLAAAQEGSLSGAARALGQTQPTLSRQVAALEAELGVTLFERTGRGLTLTETGAALAEPIRAMAEAAGRAALAASGRAEALEGLVRVTASEAVAAFLLPPVLARLRRAEPGIALEVVSSNALTDLRGREADIALRSARPTDPELFARKLGDEDARLYASDDYLAAAGPFDDPEALSAAAFVGFEDNDPFLDGLNGLGLTLSARSFGCVSADHLVHWEMVKAGAGVGVMMTRVGDATPGVRRAAPWLAPFRFPLWLVAHREVRTSRRVRRVFDHLAEAFAASPA